MQSIHGIMGSPEPNWISQVRPPPDCKYTHSTTPGLRVIGCCVAVPRSHWSAVPTPLFEHTPSLNKEYYLTNSYINSPVASLGIHDQRFPLLEYFKNPRVPIPKSRVKPQKIHRFQTPNFQIHGIHRTLGIRPNEVPDLRVKDLHSWSVLSSSLYRDRHGLLWGVL